MKSKLFILLMAALVLGACAGQQKPGPGEQSRLIEKPAQQDRQTGQQQKTPVRAQTGSLWQNSSSSLFAANIATGVGDIVTVTISEQASAAKEAETSTGRSSSASVGIPKLFGYETALANKNPNLDPSSLISASTDNSFEGSGSTSREERLSATLTTRVVEEVEGGNLRIKGSKTVRVNNEDQIIRLTGIVRPYDITAYNTIDSKYILDARIEYTGDGIISEKQRPGWLARLIDIAWPF
ncbi:flagellar L-ring protein precursor FlgH [Desulfosalsimonas propionicica]|uniref:Flagellar L-ring protein n=1 Tax=Desulfosalsimonas propionicica TaxID=332175 RepID=A0A7W0C8V3_9BACT|nr:flagellar basal body L-ring protein FlgH [Desulfosalsimonas propionicica]MBA2881324.1 flagellar L-ring protein precursor FlgH [Desulfosalsimonas propionicica]